MPDTIRTTAALLALAPDNSTGEISPQDLRDFIVSAFNRLDDSLAIKTDATSTFQNSAASGTTLSVRSNSAGSYGTLSALGSAGSGIVLRSNNTATDIQSAYQFTLLTTSGTTQKNINLTTGDITASGSQAGNITLAAGNAYTLGTTNSNGGSIVISAGNSSTIELGVGNGDGGSVTITAGYSGGEFSSPGGAITITAGAGSDGDGGNNGSDGGNVTITAGNASATSSYGGNLTIGAGNSGGLGTDGAYIVLTGGTAVPGEISIVSPTNCSINITNDNGISIDGLNGLNLTLDSYQDGLLTTSPTEKGIAVYHQEEGFLGYLIIYEDITS